MRIRNCTGARVLVVTSVDGVNVISGDTAAPSQSGYVLEPWGSVEITGWRKSLSRTAAFYFTDLGDSYAARTGRPQNVGVIGVAVFQEKPSRASRIASTTIARRKDRIGRGRSGMRRAAAPTKRARRSAGDARACTGRRRRAATPREAPRQELRRRGEADGQARHGPRPQRGVARHASRSSSARRATRRKRWRSSTTAARTCSRWA